MRISVIWLINLSQISRQSDLRLIYIKSAKYEKILYLVKNLAKYCKSNLWLRFWDMQGFGSVKLWDLLVKQGPRRPCLIELKSSPHVRCTNIKSNKQGGRTSLTLYQCQLRVSQVHLASQAWLGVLGCLFVDIGLTLHSVHLAVKFSSASRALLQRT